MIRRSLALCCSGRALYHAPLLAYVPSGVPSVARLKLQPGAVRALRGSPGKWATYSDTVVPGLELRVSPRGARLWSLRFRWHGAQPRLTLGSLARVGLARARALARVAQGQVAAGIDPRRGAAKEAGGPVTVGALCAEALAGLALADSTRREWTRLLERNLPRAIRDMPAAELDRGTIRRLGAGILKRGARTQAIHTFEALRRVYSWGVGQERIPGTPFVGLEPPAQRRVSGRWLSTEELRALWAALNALDLLAEYDRAGVGAGHDWRRGLLNHGPYVDATRLLVLTAARREMVLGARRSEFEALADPERARWIVPAKRMKGRRDHVVPLSPQARAIVERRLASGGELLFPARGGKGPMTWSSRFVRDLRDLVDAIAGRTLPAWTIHNLRHSAATHLVEDLAIAPDVVSLILAHRPSGPAIRHVYLRAERLAERREALTRWATWVGALAGK